MYKEIITSSYQPHWKNFDRTQYRFWQYYISQPVKIDLNKKSFAKQKTIQNFNIDAQGFRKTKNENPPIRDIEVTS